MARTVIVSVHDECEHGVVCSGVHEFETIEEAMEWLEEYDEEEEEGAEEVVDAFYNLYESVKAFNCAWGEFTEDWDDEDAKEFIDDVDCAITSLVNSVNELEDILCTELDD